MVRLTPLRSAEGKEKGKGTAVRRDLKETQSETAELAATGVTPNHARTKSVKASRNIG